MKRIAAILPCICFALMPFTAKADSTATLTAGNNGTIGPYSMTLSPGGSVLLFCLNDTSFINQNESWTVYVVPGGDLGSYFSGPTLTEYEEEAYVYSQVGMYGDTAVQEALWYITNPTGTEPALALADLGSTGLTNFLSSDGYDAYTYYIYDSNEPVTGITGNSTPIPQNFIGNGPPGTRQGPVAPEPSALLLLGTGLTAVAGAVRSKLTRR